MTREAGVQGQTRRSQAQARASEGWGWRALPIGLSSPWTPRAGPLDSMLAKDPDVNRLLNLGWIAGALLWAFALSM